MKSRLAGVNAAEGKLGVTRYVVPGSKPVWNQ